MVSTIRLGYFRAFGLIRLSYWYKKDEDDIIWSKTNTTTATSDPFMGILSAVFNHLIETLNRKSFNTSIVYPKVPTVGYETAENGYNGIIGLLTNDKADISTCLMPSYGLDGILNAGPVVEETEGAILSYKTGEVTSPDLSLEVFLIFTSIITFLTFFSLYVVAFLLHTFDTIQRQGTLINGKSSANIFGRFIWDLCRFPLKQITFNVIGFKKRVIFMSFSFAAVFISCVGTNLMGTTLVVRGEHKIDSLQQLFNEEENYTVFWAKSGVLVNEFRRGSTDLLRDAWRKFNRGEESLIDENDMLGYQRFTGFRQALLTETNFMNILYRGLCLLKPNLKQYIASKPYLKLKMGFGYNFKLNATVKRLADNVFKRSFESGFMVDLGERTAKKNDELDNQLSRSCLRNDNTPPVPLPAGFGQVQFIFKILLITYLAALLILCLEGRHEFLSRSFRLLFYPTLVNTINRLKKLIRRRDKPRINKKIEGQNREYPGAIMVKSTFSFRDI